MSCIARAVMRVGAGRSPQRRHIEATATNHILWNVAARKTSALQSSRKQPNLGDPARVGEINQ